MPEETDQQAIDKLLEFWFADEHKPRWYDSTEDFDERCRRGYGELLEKAVAGELSAWEDTAEGALALCLLLDQMPRNIHRGTPKAFATDPSAVAAASRAIDRGFDRELEPERRKFLYMPFMHAENLADQERCIALIREAGFEDMLPHAEEHADVIRRFGRFPHRNAILGRDTTSEEEAFLAAGAKTYGQS